MTAVQMPAISVGANPPQFILTCATPGAQIWYTLDDTFPFNGDATVYPQANGVGNPSTAALYITGTPVNIPVGGCYLRARAYMPTGTTNDDSYIASGVNRTFLPN